MVKCFAFGQVIDVKKYGPSDGLPHSTVYRIMQTSPNGFLWVGTAGGLCRFDGEEFKSYPIKNDIQARSILGITPLGEDSFIVSCYRSGLYLFANDSCVSRLPYQKPRVKNVSQDLTHITSVVDIKKQRWVVSGKRLHRIESDSVVLHSFIELNDIFVEVHSIMASEDILYVGTSDGLFSVTQEGENCKIWPSPQVSKAVWDVSVGPNGRIVFGTETGVHEYKNRLPVQLISGTEGLDVRLLYCDSKERIWFSSQGQSLYMFDTMGLADIEMTKANEDLLIADIHEDETGNIWLATMGDGLYKVRVTEGVNLLNSKGKYPGFISGMTHTQVGVSWIGSYGSVFKTTLGGSTIRQVEVPLQKSEIVYGFCSGATEDQVLATTSKQILFFDKGAFSSNQKGLGARSICLRKKGGYWIGTFTGLGYMEHPFTEVSYLKSPRFSNHIYYVHEDREERLWVSTDHGLFIYQNKSAQKVDLPNGAKINHIFESSRGSFYLATNAGTFVWSPTSDDTVFSEMKFSRLLGPGEGNSLAVFEDSSHLIWIVIEAGLVRVKTSKAMDVFNINTWTELKEIQKACYLKNDKVLLGTSNKLIEVDLQKIKELKDVPIPYFNALSSDGESYDFKKPIHLPFGKKELTIAFSKISYVNRPCIYYYRLDTKSEWLTTRNKSLSFYGLASGKYRFQLKAGYEKSKRQSEPKSFDLYIDQPIWHKTWFVLLAFLLFFASTWSIVHYRIRSLKRRQSHEMKQESERSVLKHRALNAMMNPHFITNSLYAIKQMAAGETHNARRIERYVVNFSSLVRVNLENAVNLCVSLEVELDRLDKYVEMEQFRLQHSFSYRTEIEETLEVDMIKIPNMILQPLVENAIWHGLSGRNGDGHISLKILELDQEHLRIIVEDNGKGYANTLEERLRPSFGLEMIEEKLRLHHANNKLRIQTLNELEHGSVGTRVSIDLHI